MPRIIFHIDVNSAFLSWSAVKFVREGKPDIRLIPSVVSGDPDDRRSIITAASIPAKKRIKGDPSLRFHRKILEDGTDCFEVVLGSKAIERHCVLT